MPNINNIARGFVAAADRIFKFGVVHAHCDIPCGIYDPHQAQLAAHTIIRMDMLIEELNKSSNTDIEAKNKMIRCVRVKEEHGEMCEEEIETLWGDYFKPDHYKKYPELQQLIWDTIQLASKTKQSTKISDAEALLANVEKIAEIFWATKGVGTVKAKSFYPTERTFIYPKPSV